MGIIKKGINGPFKGKAGSVIGSSWKKISYIKGLRRDKGMKRPPTQEQAIQRQKFAMLAGFLSTFKPVVNIGFIQFTEKATGVNAAFRYNYEQAFFEDDNDITLNYPALKLSHGSLVTAGAERVFWESSNRLRVTWNPKTYGMGGEADDRTYAVAYLPQRKYAAMNEHGEVRQSGVATIDFHEPSDDRIVHVWLFFSDKFGKRVSRTVYIPLDMPDATINP